DRVEACSDIKEVVHYCDNILFVVPSAYVETTASAIEAEDMKGKNLILSIKGMIPGHSMIPSEFLGKGLNVPYENQMIIGGPCHAEEVALERKTYMTIAGEVKEKAEILARSIDLDYIKAISSDDLLGVEMAAIMKNVIGIACGIAHGLNYGDNFQAVLVSNAL